MTSHLIIAASGTTERFMVIIAFLTAILSFAVIGIPLVVGAFRAVGRQIAATEANTQAIKRLDERLERVEHQRNVS